MKSAAQIKQQQAAQLIRVIKWFGSQKRLAESCGYSAPTVTHWIRRGKISKKGAVKVEALTDKHFTKEDMRPDVMDWGGVK